MGMGDVPLWETGTFQDLFIGFQEAVGMRKKRPSKLARDLVLHLLVPGERNRATAVSALRHQWFRSPLPQEGSGENDQQPSGIQLLDWKDFEDGLAVVGRDLQWAMEMMTGSLNPAAVEVDDPLKTCIVCYTAAGSAGVGYMCPQCHHIVCAQCLAHLPKSSCPYCRHEAVDMPVTKKSQQLLQVQRPSSSSDLLPCARPEKARLIGVQARQAVPV